MPKVFDGKNFKRDEERAAASAATGHIRTKGDDRYYRWMRDLANASPERPGVSGGLAPHHILGLAQWARLTEGMSPEEVALLESDLNSLGLGMGDKPLNLVGLEADVKSTGSSISGSHDRVHKNEKELLKKLGIKKKGEKLFLGSTPFSEMDFTTRRELLIGMGLRMEEDLENEMRKSSEDFFSQPDYQEQLEQIRQRSSKKPMPAGGANWDSPLPTGASKKMLSSPGFLESQGPAWKANILSAAERLRNMPVIPPKAAKTLRYVPGAIGGAATVLGAAGDALAVQEGLSNEAEELSPREQGIRDLQTASGASGLASLVPGPQQAVTGLTSAVTGSAAGAASAFDAAADRRLRDMQLETGVISGDTFPEGGAEITQYNRTPNRFERRNK